MFFKTQSYSFHNMIHHSINNLPLIHSLTSNLDSLSAVITHSFRWLLAPVSASASLNTTSEISKIWIGNFKLLFFLITLSRQGNKLYLMISNSLVLGLSIRTTLAIFSLFSSSIIISNYSFSDNKAIVKHSVNPSIASSLLNCFYNLLIGSCFPNVKEGGIFNGNFVYP